MDVGGQVSFLGGVLHEMNVLRWTRWCPSELWNTEGCLGGNHEMHNPNPEATVTDHSCFMLHIERCGLELVLAVVAHMWAESVECRLLHSMFKGLENVIHQFKTSSIDRRVSQRDLRYRSCP